jgi:ATP-dependent Clp protease ATP-binding subunit ClpC
MPKINVYLPDALAEAVKEAQLPVSSICQAALESAVQKVQAATTAGSTAASPSRQARARARPRRRRDLNEHVDTVHLLVGIVDEGGNLGLKVLQSLDIEPADLRSELMGSMPPKTAAAVDTPHGYAGRDARSSSLRRRRWRWAQLHRVRAHPPGRARDRRHDGRTSTSPHGVDVIRSRAVVSALSGFVHRRLRRRRPSHRRPNPASKDPSPPRRDRAAPRERVSDNARRVNVRYDVEGRWIVRLDRPEKLNAFTFEMVGEIRSVIDAAASDPA